ncbi:DNA-directed RNA polymerase III, putative, partial [Trypanosoma cruzi]
MPTFNCCIYIFIFIFSSILSVCAAMCVFFFFCVCLLLFTSFFFSFFLLRSPPRHTPNFTFLVFFFFFRFPVGKSLFWEMPLPTRGSDDAAYNTRKLALLPALIGMKGLLNHHIASFDHLINVELKRILLNESNREIKSSIDPDFSIRYTNIRVCQPREIVGKGQLPKVVSPHECRTRDLTYRGDMIVDVEYTSRDRNKRPCTETDIKIGTIPIMLKSSSCNLFGKTREELVAMRECPLDPGGYFIIKGVEKVCLVQEQQSKNRVIIEADDNGNIVAHVQSKTHYSIS